MQTRTPGITLDANRRPIIDKEHRGIRFCARLGQVSQRQAEERLHVEIGRIDAELQRDVYSRPRFLDCTARYLAESRFKRSAKVIEWHVRQLNSHVGHFEIERVHDETLKAFVVDRSAARVSATTINRSLEVVRTILNRAPRVIGMIAGARGSVACRHSLLCCPNRPDRPTP